jgi:acetyltransferase-like isoleucine patch superfamily enzyme
MRTPFVFRLYRNLRKFRYQRAIQSLQNVRIHPTAKVNYANINIHPDVTLEIGAGSIVEGIIISERSGAAILIGEHTFVASSSFMAAERIEIGNDVLIASGCTIVDHNAHSIFFEKRRNDVREWYYGRKDWSVVTIKPVRIKDGAWIGFNSILLKGVTIGERAVVGAGSVVMRDVPASGVVMGNPARNIFDLDL